MRRVAARLGFGWIAAWLALSLPLSAQQPPDSFRWMDFHAPKDQSIVIWVTRSLQVEKWTAIREIGVLYDAALVVTTERSGPEALPGDDSFTIWSVSLTNHSFAPLLTGVNLRWFGWQRFSSGTPLELPVLYDNCRDCAASTYFTAFHYDAARHDWEARWIRGGQGIPVWNSKTSSGVAWTQVYALLPEADGHAELCTWNHFDYGKQKPPEDFLYRYGLDPFSGLDRMAAVTGKQAEAMKARLCETQNAVPGLARGQDSPLCEEVTGKQTQRRPMTTPPANNRGQSAPPGARRR